MQFFCWFSLRLSCGSQWAIFTASRVLSRLPCDTLDPFGSREDGGCVYLSVGLPDPGQSTGLVEESLTSALIPFLPLLSDVLQPTLACLPLKSHASRIPTPFLKLLLVVPGIQFTLSPFTMEERVAEVKKAKKNTGSAVDRITWPAIRNLPREGFEELHETYNNIWVSGDIPKA